MVITKYIQGQETTMPVVSMIKPAYLITVNYVVCTEGVA
jgi:hypothetical protein